MQLLSQSHRRPAVVLALLALWGCDDYRPEPSDASMGTGPGVGDSEGAAGSGAPAASQWLAESDDGWRRLIVGEWEIPAETETYRCVRLTVPEDVYVRGLRPISPVGTHHTVLSVSDTATQPDGLTECTAFDNGQRMIGGSGVGTEPVMYPDGIAYALRAGEQLMLNLHLFNVESEPLSGLSGIEVKTIDAEDADELAEGLLAGPVDLEIPPGRVVQQGQCTFDHDATIVSILPHMHQLGVHMKITARSSVDGDVVIWDAPYDFDDQQAYPVDFVEMAEGDVLEVECTYENDTDQTVMWGDSSLSEMCFAGVVRFPNAGSPNACVQ
jgi:hypothetical protein